MIATDYGNALKFLKFLIQTPPSSVAWNSPPFTPQFQPPSVDLILTPVRFCFFFYHLEDKITNRVIK